jgi:hypothetical protein
VAEVGIGDVPQVSSVMRWLLPTTWAAWLFDHVPLGAAAPYVFGFIIGRWPKRKRD